MEYRYTAHSIGWLANKILSEKKTTPLVRLLFDNTLYLDSIDDMIIVTKKHYLSPITVDLYPNNEEKPFSRILKIREKAIIDKNLIRIGNLTINIDKAGIYKSRRIAPPSLDSLREACKILDKSLKMTLILYSSTNAKFPIFKTLEFKKFINEVVYPFMRGDAEILYNTEKYRMLLGVGEGFTPSGDDFILGFIGVINFFHKLLSIRKVRLNEKILFESTNWASAMYIRYMQQEIYDEKIEDFFSAISSCQPHDALDSLFSIARRGHISGLDISLGLTIGLASIAGFLIDEEIASNTVSYTHLLK